MGLEREIETAAAHPLDDNTVVERLVDVMWKTADSHQPPVHPEELTIKAIRIAVLKSRHGLPSLEAIGRRFAHTPDENHELAAVQAALAKIAFDQSAQPDQ